MIWAKAHTLEIHFYPRPEGRGNS